MGRLVARIYDVHMIVDHEWRRAIVPVYVRRALEK